MMRPGREAAARDALQQARARLLAAEQARDALLASDTWQATAPLRHVLAAHPNAASLLRRLVNGGRALADGTLWPRLRHRVQLRESAAEMAPRSLDEARMLDFVAMSGTKRIVVADQSVPAPDRFAGARSTVAVLEILRDEGWAVALWAFDRRAGLHNAAALEARGIAVADDRYRGTFAEFLSTAPGPLDHVMLMRPRVAEALLPAVLASTPALISYYGHDLHFARMRLAARLARDFDLADLAEAMLAAERRVWRVVDAVIYPSEDETRIVHALEPEVLSFAMPGYSFATFPPSPSPVPGQRLLFVGGFAHTPNVDAVLWFAREILPLVRMKAPGATMTVVGAEPPAVVRTLAGPAVTITGGIDDAALRAYYTTHRLALAPLRIGAGVKGKVVEALQAGLPVVTTTVGVQGLPGLDAIVAVTDTTAGQAEAVLRLLKNDAAWTAQATAQIAYARTHFSREAMRAALLAALGETT